MKIILISGKAGHGKTTVADILKDKLEKLENKVLITNYGDLVKYVCKTFFNWDGEKDIPGRTLLQYVGTDKIRTYRNSFWVDFVADILSCFKDEWDYVLIPDVRFPDEIEEIKLRDFDCTTLRVERLSYNSILTEEQQSHISEIALDCYNFDVTIWAETGELKDMIEVQWDEIGGLIL